MVSLAPEMICGGCNSSYTSCALSYPYLYYACGPVILVHSLADHSTLTSLQHHKGFVNTLLLMDSFLVSGGTDKQLVVWSDFQVLSCTPLSSSLIHLATGSNYLVCITGDGTLSVFSKSLSLLQTLNFRKNLQETCAISHLGNTSYLATGGADARVHLYTSTGADFEYQVSLEGHVRNIRSLSFRMEAEAGTEALWLASAGQDSLVRVWKFSADVEANSICSQGVYAVGQIFCKLDAVISGHTGLVSSVVWVDTHLLTASHDFTVVLWQENARSWLPKATFGQLGGNKNIFIGALGLAGRILAYSYSGGFTTGSRRPAGGGWPRPHPPGTSGWSPTLR